ncbi:sugar transferase [Metabacillus indicus]|uniref:Multidrug MFS transporter n=1 Tax=Metabacillus indicus TaxID=246786 RepID=A0A084GXY9_METID|nr:sugar transferase [Metabacillus indicus]KEZ52201.1 multidrug MFS transporter [Metabacillus indicus]
MKTKEFNISQSFTIEEKRSYLIIKRIIDIFGSIIGIFITSILFIIVCLAIKIEDPKGPVFFSQVRVGKNKKEYKIYKFRSMVFDAEKKLEELLKYNEVSGAMFKMKDDPRVTKVGKFIRKTSIDELPQLLNVLKGEMSLVGPRPPLPREVKEYNNYHLARLAVTPGCTGLWQVTSRNSVGFDEMVELDLEYINNRSILLDFKIIFKTILVLFGSKNAF